jgi:hypothetical protein
MYTSFLRLPQVLSVPRQNPVGRDMFASRLHADVWTKAIVPPVASLRLSVGKTMLLRA